MSWLSTPALEALDAFAGAGSELVLLPDNGDWHRRAVATGAQLIEGPCWVAPDRGPGRRPPCLRIVAPDTIDELRHAGLVLVLGGRAMLTERSRRRIETTAPGCHGDALGGTEVAAGAPDAS